MTVLPGVRRIDCDGAFNIRDLGGYETTNGWTVRWRTLYRADGLHRIAPAAMATVAALGWKTVIDLRTPGELEHGAFGRDGVATVHLPVLPETWEGRVFQEADPVEFLAARYLEMLHIGAPAIAAAVDILASPARLPAVFHCSAGKDRTGVLAALVLSMLGVDDEVIAADYHLSAEGMDKLMARIVAAQPQVADVMARQPAGFLACPPEAMLRFLDRLDDHFGSAEGYLLEIGVPADAIERCRDLMLEP